MEEKINSKKDGSSLKCITNETKNAEDSTPLGTHAGDNPNPATVAPSCKPSATYCGGSNLDAKKVSQVISVELSDDNEKNYPCLHLASSSWRPRSQTDCMRCEELTDAESQNQIIADNDCRTKAELNNYDVTPEPFSSKEENKILIDNFPDIRYDLSQEIDWDSYRNYLFNIWEENSLSNSSLDIESSTLPSLSSISGEFPYALNLLTAETYSPNLSISTDESQENTPEAKYSESSAQCKRRNCTIPIVNCELELDLEKPNCPRPLVNTLKESCSNSQGDVGKNSTQMLRPQAQNKHLQVESSPSQHCQEGQMPCEDIKGRTTPQYRLRRLEPLPSRHTDENLPPKFTVPGNEISNKYSERHFPSSCCNKHFPNSKGKSPSTNNHKEQCNNGFNLREEAETNDIEMRIQKEIDVAQVRIMTLSHQMEEQSARLQLLIEARERKPLEEPFEEISPTRDPRMTYPVLPQGYKTPHHEMYTPNMGAYGYGHPALGRRASCQYPYEAPGGRAPVTNLSEDILMSRLTRVVPRELENLRDSIVALQMQNIELNLFLKKEELKRKEAEEAVKKEKEYVKKLQHSLQDLSTSTLVMDPLTYKQVADKYMASRKKAVRRTHTCNPSFLGSSDLVCDSNKLEVSQKPVHSTSCPSSPLGSNQDRRTSAFNPPRDTAFSRLTEGVQLPHAQTSWEENAQGSSRLDPQDYNGLLHSLEGLQLSSSPS